MEHGRDARANHTHFAYIPIYHVSARTHTQPSGDTRAYDSRMTKDCYCFGWQMAIEHFVCACVHLRLRLCVYGLPGVRACKRTHHTTLCFIFLLFFFEFRLSDVIQNKNMRRFPAWILEHFYVQLYSLARARANRVHIFFFSSLLWLLLLFSIFMCLPDAVLILLAEKKKSSEIYSARWIYLLWTHVVGFFFGFDYGWLGSI